MATESIRIRVDATGTRVVRRDLAAIGTTSTTAAQGVNLLRRALLFVGVAESIRRVTGTLASFSQSMSTVRAITGATETEFAALSARAEELGAATRFSATQAADGLIELSRAGFTATESIESIDEVLGLAQAGGIDLATAATITVGALKGFRVEVDQAARFTDVLVAAANSATTDVTELGDAFKYVAPAAATLEVPFETTAAALDVLANNMLRGQMGGTGLRKVLSVLAKAPKPLRRALADAGLTMEDVNVQSLGLVKVLRNLERANIDVGKQFEIFGDRGQPAFNVLVQNIPTVEELNEKLQDAGGTVGRVAAIMDDNLNGALLRVKSAIEAVILAFGRLGGEGVLRSILEGIATALRAVANNANYLQGILTVLAASTLPLVLRSLNAIRVAILANPLGALSGAIAVATGLLVAFRDEIKVTEDGVTSLGDVGRALGEVMSEGFDAARAAGDQALQETVKTWNAVFGDDLPVTFWGFLDVVAIVFDSFIGFFSGVGAVVKVAFEEPLETMGFLFIAAINAIIEAFNWMLQEISKGLRSFKDNLAELATYIPKWGQDIADKISNVDVTLPQLGTLENQFEEQGEKMGDAWVIGFQKSTQAEDLVARLRERSAQIGAERALAAEPADTQEITLTKAGKPVAEIADDLDKATTAAGGFQEAMRQAALTSVEFGESLAGIGVGAIEQLSDATADFIASGLRDFESFRTALANIFGDIGKQILSLIIRFLVLQAVSSALGGAVGGAAGAAGNLTGAGAPTAVLGRQAGGPVNRGEPYVVGERGRELFVPPSRGNVVPSSRSEPAQVNLSVVNVTDPDEVTSVLNTRAGEQAVLNVISKNARQVSSLVAGGV